MSMSRMELWPRFGVGSRISSTEPRFTGGAEYRYKQLIGVHFEINSEEGLQRWAYGTSHRSPIFGSEGITWNKIAAAGFDVELQPLSWKSTHKRCTAKLRI